MRVLPMRKQVFGFALLLIAAGDANSEARPEPSDRRFERYPASKVFQGKPAAARLTSARERRYRTRLTEDSLQGPNFAGHYTVVFWGCGTGCAQVAVVNAFTGKVSWVPLEWSDIPDVAGVSDNRNFRLNSRLLILTRSNYDAHATYTEYGFLMTNNGLRLISKRTVDPASANSL